MHHLLDSSAWLAYLQNEPLAKTFEHLLAPGAASIIVPTICIYEVMKVALRELPKEQALHIQAALLQHDIVPITQKRALEAAHISLSESIPMADSIILTITKEYDATLWTLDADFVRTNYTKLEYLLPT